MKIKNQSFPVVRYFTLKIGFILNILCIIAAGRPTWMSVTLNLINSRSESTYTTLPFEKQQNNEQQHKNKTPTNFVRREKFADENGWKHCKVVTRPPKPLKSPKCH